MNMRMYLVKQRKKLNLSMRKAAKIAELDFHHYYRIETGQIRLVNFIVLCKIGQAMSIELNELFAAEAEYLSYSSD